MTTKVNTYSGDNVDFNNTNRGSVWGDGDPETLEELDKLTIRGKWLNLGCGDGRYNGHLVENADNLTVLDINEQAISKLYDETPEKYRGKIEKVIFDMTKPLPFADSTFDGVFCMGTLHLFATEKLRAITQELTRILKHNGILFVDLATDISRITSNGDQIVFDDEPQYKLNEATALLRDLLTDFDVDIREASVQDDFVDSNPPYEFGCNFIIVKAVKT